MHAAAHTARNLLLRHAQLEARDVTHEYGGMDLRFDSESLCSFLLRIKKLVARL